MWPEHEMLQKRSRKLQSFEDKLTQRRTTHTSCPKRNAQARIEIEKLQTELEDDGQKIKAETLNDPELDLEVRALREGEGRRGSNGSCFDSSILAQFIAMGTQWAKQQFAILRSELDKVDVQHQPRRRQHSKCPESRRERSNQPRQEQEEVGTRSRASQRTLYVGTQRQRGSQPRFSSWCCSDSTLLPNHGTGGDGGEFDSPRGGEEHRGRRSASKGDHSTTKTRSRSPRGRSAKGRHGTLAKIFNK